MGVGNLNAERHALSADIAFCHIQLHLLIKAMGLSFRGAGSSMPVPQRSLKKNNRNILADSLPKIKSFLRSCKKCLNIPGKEDVWLVFFRFFQYNSEDMLKWYEIIV